MSPEEVERQLARLSKLALAAGQRLDELSRDVNALRTVIDNIEATFVVLGSASTGDEKKAANGTLDPEVAQVEVVTK